MKKQLSLLLALFILTISFCCAQGPVLWALTSNGGQQGLGTIITYDVATQTEAVQYSLNTLSGQNPYGNLFKAGNGLLYAPISSGGQDQEGSFVSFNINNRGYVDLIDFGTGQSSGNHPCGSIMQGADSLLYGLTDYGGAVTGTLGEGSGEIFSYNINTRVCADIHDFGNDSDGYYPFGSPIQANDGLLYGMTQNGGTNNIAASGSGIIFSYNISTQTYSMLHNFGSSTDGQTPLGSLFQATDSLLYGMTQHGGIHDSLGAGSGGTIFSYNISNGNYTVLHSFGGSPDGYGPWGNLIQAGDSLLYGMTESGGMHHGGIIFSYNIFTGAYTQLYNFGSGADGISPLGSLFLASDGLLYGMTTAGGANNAAADSAGTIFSYNITTGVETVLHNFTGGLDGAEPFGSFIEANQLPPPLGIRQLSADNNGLTIFPNPSSGAVTVKLPDSQNSYTAKVYNVMGNEIYRTILSGSQNTINLSDQAAGMYYVYLISPAGTAVGKMLVTK